MTQLQSYTLAEVSVNNGKDAKPTWIVVRDVVYDVTQYLIDHPGGSELITEFAGRDATRDFEEFGHSINAKADLAKLKIGVLVESDKLANRKKKVNIQIVDSKNDSTKSTIYEKIEHKKKKFSFFFC